MQRFAVVAASAVLCATARCWAQAATGDPVGQGVVDSNDRTVELAPLAARSLLLDIARAGNTLVAVGEHGHVLLSLDDGSTWVQSAAVPARTTLTAVCFADAQHGWAVGHDEIILNTSDGGKTWTRSHYAPESQQPLLDVWFADSLRGITIGAYGTFLTTADGGKTWASRKFESQPLVKEKRDAPPDPNAEAPPDYHLNHIAAAGKYLFIGAEAGNLYRSDDGGAHWLALPSPYNGSFFGLLPLGGDSLLAMGLRGNLFRSNDAGASWQKLTTGTTAMLTDGAVLNAHTVALVGLSGVVLISQDGGATFALRQQQDRKGISALQPGTSGSIVVVGESGAKRVQW